MRYQGAVYRPPSEAYSLIIQVTLGCSHNKCTFCKMFKDKKFKIRKYEDIIEDLISARKYYKRVDRIFLADGDALILKTEDLEKILLKIKELFPECRRVGIYGTPGDIMRKSIDELKRLKELGLKILYLGVESGSDNILKKINKGATSDEMILAGKKVMESGIKLSITIISGLGGISMWEEHAKETGRVISAINPDYLGLLTLLVEPNTELYDEVQRGQFKLLSPKEIVAETKLLLEHLNVSNCIFRSNHASNYIPLAGTLPQDKENLISLLNEALNSEFDYRDEHFRRL
ncbi:radical SAM protein [Clostridiisalibacter paucivorans]|uniref:radical SAM protein n=1 Tax=Clostridiisalibacter paucivorans TaxID=408753 RepID=UPI00047B3DB3|nr:radical SAM protein [Clostridiisalibacter paucivorans]